jgi:hypothetical protein
MKNRELILKVRKQLPRGENMPKGKGWLLISPSGKTFSATNRFTENLNYGDVKYRLAVFRVPKY